MKVYISGPITGLPHDQARATFDKAAALLAETGHEPVNPMALPTDRVDCCPESVSNAGTSSGHTWACYLRKDIRALLDCDAILLLPGWASSHGARLELQVAAAVGLHVLLADPSPATEPGPVLVYDEPL